MKILQNSSALINILKEISNLIIKKHRVLFVKLRHKNIRYSIYEGAK